MLSARQRQRDVDMRPRLIRPLFQLVLSGLFFALAAASGAAQVDGLPSFDCERSFVADDNADTLARRFSAEAVTAAEIYLGEGFYETGTVMFGSTPARRVEILWHDVTAKARPKVVRVQGERSEWRTPSGVTVGLGLRTLEQLNGRPFRMTGFGTDYEGTQLSWSGGRLDRRPGSACAIRARLRPDDSVNCGALYGQVIGAREFSSGHQAMQCLNPDVYEMWLDFRK